MAKYKVMFIVHSLGIGGVERLVYDMARALDIYDLEAIVCCLDKLGVWGEELKKMGFRVFDLKREKGFDIEVIKKIKAILNTEHPDILHAHQYTPYFYTVASSISPNRPRIIFTEHGRFYPDRAKLRRIIFNQFGNLFTDEIVGVSEFSKRALVKFEHFPAAKIKVIYNGVKTEDFPAKSDPAAIRRSLGLKDEDKIIGTVGRLCAEKNYAMLIRAFAEVKKVIKEAKLIFAGEGGLEKELKTLSSRLGLEKEIIFLGARQDIPELLSVFDIFALSSDSEAASLVLLEAMASGKAVVATAAGGNPELVIDKETGILTPRGDYKKFSQAIISILQNPAAKSGMERSGVRLIKEKFTFERMLAGYADMYRNLLERRLLRMNNRLFNLASFLIRAILLSAAAAAAGILSVFKKYRYASTGPSAGEDVLKYIHLDRDCRLPGVEFVDLQNKKLVPSRFKFYYQPYGEPDLEKLRTKYRLDEVTKTAGDELEEFILLRNWTRGRFKATEYQPVCRYFNALQILEENRRDINTFMRGKNYSACNGFAFLYVQTLLSMGFQARAVTVVDDYPDIDRMHCVVEAWSDRFAKWVVMDVFLNLYYEKDSVPLNALELHNALYGDPKTIRVNRQPQASGDDYNQRQFTLDELLGYYKHFRVEFRNDWMTNCYQRGHVRRSDLISVWWHDKNYPVRYAISPKTANPGDLYWPLNQVEILTARRPDSASPGLKLLFATITPNFKYFEVTIDDGKPVEQASALFNWVLHKGRNRLRVLSVNEYYRKGPPSEIILLKE